MAENGYAAPMPGHHGRIPNYGKTQVNPMGGIEPPACIQNAMMTKDKKPFTYTPGGLDLSQIRTPSMARRLARQKSQEEHEHAYAAHNSGGYRPQGGPVPPPPPPPQIPAPPPPPPLLIEVSKSKSPKPIVVGERPEIVIPENPIGMLRKTNSPYHWEAEKAETQRLGAVPKFVEKVPSPLTVKMPPSTFSQQPPQTYTPQGQNNFQRPNYQYGNQNHTPESPVHRPEPQYANQKSASPNVNGSPQTREILQRQDSQFNKSPQPFGNPSPISNGTPYSPTPNNNWRQPEKRDSPNIANSPQSPHFNRNQFSPNPQQQYSPNTQQQYSPNTQQQYSPNIQQQYSPNTQQQYSSNTQQQYSPNPKTQTSIPNSGPAFHTLPRSGPRGAENQVNCQNNNAIYNNTRETVPSAKVESSNPTPWRTNTLNRHPKEAETPEAIYHNSHNTTQVPTYTPPWKNNEVNNNQVENSYIPPWKQENKNVNPQQFNQQQTLPDSNNNRAQDNYSPPWRTQQNDKKTTPIAPANRSNQPEQPRYQSSMQIPVTPRKEETSQPVSNNNTPQKEVVYVNQEPVYFCPESPQSIPPWVKTQKEKTKTPPPVWVQRPLERKSAPRELVTPPRDTNQEPEWVRKSNDMQRGVREVVSPPKYQQTAQPTWSTRPSENRKSLPRDSTSQPNSQGTRVIPIQMEISSTDSRDQGGNQQPPLRIMINMQQMPSQGQGQAPLSQPTQRIMRVLSPQLVKLDDSVPQQELPTLNRSLQSNQESQNTQPKTRIIPIQIEGGSGGGANKRVFYHKFNQEGNPRQSKAFKVLQIITGTQDADEIQSIEEQHGYSDL